MPPGTRELIGELKPRTTTLALLVGAAVIAVLVMGPIPQDPSYHRFADTRSLLGVSNFWNVVSNLPFLLVGTLGLTRLPALARAGTAPGYVVLCLGLVLTGLGSAWYHLAPSNGALLWDRLPMTLAFMALLSLLLEERVLGSHRPRLLWSLISFGVVAVLYWAWTEARGHGDLRPYVLAQFLPVALVPVLLVLHPRRYLHSKLLFASFLFYASAKVFEHFDGRMLEFTGIMGGHALKHVIAALAALCIVYAVPTRHDHHTS